MALAKFCEFWPFFAGPFLQQPWCLQAVKATWCASFTAVSCSWHHGECNPPIINAWAAGWGDWVFFYWAALSAKMLPVTVSSCIGDTFISWSGYFCFPSFFLVIFIRCFTFTKVFAEPGFQTTQREKLAAADTVSHPSWHSPPLALPCWAYLLFSLYPSNLILQTIYDRA